MIVNIKDNKEDKAESERYSQAGEILDMLILSVSNRPGALISKVKGEFSRINELKSYHFDRFVDRKFLQYQKKK